LRFQRWSWWLRHDGETSEWRRERIFAGVGPVNKKKYAQRGYQFCPTGLIAFGQRTWRRRASWKKLHWLPKLVTIFDGLSGENFGPDRAL
jgi:hypothetical protein